MKCVAAQFHSTHLSEILLQYYLYFYANDQQTHSNIHLVTNRLSLFVPLLTIQESIPHVLASIGWHMLLEISLEIYWRILVLLLYPFLHGVAGGINDGGYQNMIVFLAKLL